MYLILYKTAQDFDNILLFFALRSLKCHYIMEYVVILKEDKTPTSIGGELRQFSLGGSPISFQDKASGGLQRCADVLYHAKHDAHLAASTPRRT